MENQMEVLIEVAEQNALFTKALESQLIELRRINNALVDLKSGFTNGFRADIKSHSTRLVVGSWSLAAALGTLGVILSSIIGCI